MVRVDLVVVSYNSREHLRNCVATLSAEDWINVIVVDNASSDGSLESVADLPLARIPLAENGGFGYGCNAGWRAGAAPVVLFLNPDATMEAGSVERLAAALDADARAGVVAPKVLEPDGSLVFSQRRYPTLVSTYAQALFLHRVFSQARWADEIVRDPAAYDRAGTIDWVSGSSIMVRRAALEQVGGFDEGFFMYCEETDLCFRLRDQGFAVRFEPEAVCHHIGGASAPRASLIPVHAQSRVRYARKHRGRAGALVERGGIALGALTHAALSSKGKSARAGHARALRRVVSRQPAL